ncbi:putative membrane-bound acid phosphatase 2 [Trypanosoma rangeli]|uniref:Putative membrane-bound acid phosphatase 2 n=1 Tax=Trypanosoma rangeli TaxID=5698 RepID=A0A3R7MEN7_TRYRA|nr:putative membrane-bound acid phosphatase 2 [Trypanosoma rangeli]RNF01141.1 putative membrane-bound acid phosphatase 2 [Trypanosoma rangeli]|eukprot:RNF01141.1 putative membrane-bound acid phosphatase 2 [Trypanosoma rangeli]
MTVGGTWRWARSAAVWLVALLLLLLHVGGGDAAVTLRLVQVVHRHGSRSAIVKYNTTQICGDIPCGYLNAAGRTMLLKAGEFLREHYNSNTAKPFFSSENYDPSVSYSRSTDVPRTLQSAAAFLYGLFPNRSTAFPVIHTVNKTTDWLLRTDVIPYTRVFYLLDNLWKREVGSPKVDEIIDLPTLQAVAGEAFSEEACANPAKRSDCAFKLFDIGAALEAVGRIEKFPLLKANLEKLRSFAEFYFRTEYSYNKSDEERRKLGSCGQLLMQQLLANAQLHMLGKSTYKLYHYSTHDITLSPLAATLADDTPEAVLPPFAQLYAFELLYDDEANAYSMRVMRGSPGQTPDTEYAFSWDGFQLKCMTSGGKVYKARNNTCPYDDFLRLVDSSRPTDPAGLCHLNDRYKALLGCPTQGGGALNSHCQAYRLACPASSCRAGHTLEPVTLQCVCSSASCMGRGGANVAGDGGSCKKTVSAGATAGIALGCFAVGAIIVACIAVLVVLPRGNNKHMRGVLQPA